LHGIKTNYGIIGLNGNATRRNCNDNRDESKFTDSIASWFLNSGRSAGVVTTTRITHATPAGIYAHSTERDWENNAQISVDFCDHTQIDDIAEQLLFGNVGSKLKVVLGGGSKNFINSTEMMHEKCGERTDGKNLINDWLNVKSTRKFVKNRAELLALNNDVDQLFGLFHSDHLPYNMEVTANNLQDEIPLLSTMTNKAIDILSKDDNGYFMLVEGGRIDHAHHDSFSKYALEETNEFHKTIQSVVDRVNLNETLIVVTADHGHGFTISGYAVSFELIQGTEKN
jgi:alkaline phosphatase